MNSGTASSRGFADEAGIPRNAEGPVFREPWEAQAFALDTTWWDANRQAVSDRWSTWLLAR